MMRIRLADTADVDRWDRYVERSAKCSAYHRWAYRSALEDAYGLRTRYLVAENDQGDVTGILPSARIPRLGGPGSLCALPYCDLGGPVADNPAIEEQLIAALVEGESGSVELRGSQTDDATASEADGEALSDGNKVRMILDLPASADALFAGFKSKHRSQINKARKNGLVATVDSGVARVGPFYEVFTRNMRELGSPTHSQRWFECIAEYFDEDCLLGQVCFNGEVIGAGIVLINGPRAVIPWASTLRSRNHLAPNMLLYWSLLEAVVERGCVTFDFGRSTFGEGTFRFKRQWGARPVRLDWRRVGAGGEEQSMDGSPARRSAFLRSLAESLWRRLPLPLTIAVGSRLRPMISL